MSAESHEGTTEGRWWPGWGRKRREPPGGAPDQHPWPWWRRLLTNDQNIAADIETVRAELSITARRKEDLGPDEQRILENCQYMLGKVIDNNKSLLKNKIFVRQTLSSIMQQILLITPRENLEYWWLGLKKLLESAGDNEKAFYADSSKAIDQYLTSGRTGADQEGRIRRLMKRIRSSLDARVMGDLWTAIYWQRMIDGSALIGLSVLITLVGVIIAENSPSGWFCLQFPLDAKKQHGIVQTCLAGLLGGILSLMTRPTIDGEGAQSLPVVKVVIARPIIGAITGLFLYVLSGVGAFNVTYPTLYAMALAFGFSEQLFIRLLNRTAGQASTGVSKAIGHTGARAKAERGRGGDAGGDDRLTDDMQRPPRTTRRRRNRRRR